MENRDEHDEKLFKPILDLIRKDIQQAVLLKQKLTPEQQKRFDKYLAVQVLYTESNSYRGKVIGMTVNLEMILGKILSYYFTDDSDKRNQLNFLIFDRMNLSTKFNKFKKIISSKFPVIWRLNKDKIKEIGDLIEFRNDLAHSILNTTESGVEKITKLADEVVKEQKDTSHGEEVQIGYYDNFEIVFRTVRKEEVDNYHRSCYKAIELLENIARQIIPKYR